MSTRKKGDQDFSNQIVVTDRSLLCTSVCRRLKISRNCSGSITSPFPINGSCRDIQSAPAAFSLGALGTWAGSGNITDGHLGSRSAAFGFFGGAAFTFALGRNFLG